MVDRWAASSSPCIAALALGVLGACTLKPPTDDAPRPRTTVLSVEVSPATAKVQPGGRLALHASVTGTGEVPQAVRWRVDCETGCTSWFTRAGEIDGDGVYRAPWPPPDERMGVRVAAASVVSPGVTGGALLEIPPPSVTVAPAHVELFPGDRVQFAAAVEGTIDPTVQWSAWSGTVDADGVYVAPAHPYGRLDRVVARSVALVDFWPLDTGEASVVLALRPPTLTGTSGSAAAGDVLTVFGSGLDVRFFDTQVEVVFTDGTGGPVAVRASTVAADRVTVVVPPAAATGPLRVRLVTPESPTATSEPLAFERSLRLRVHAARSEVAAGESTRIAVAFLGAAGSFPVTFEADVGAMTSDVYTAPPSLDAPGHANVKTCLAGTTTCAGTTIAIRPFRVSPSPAIVAAGGSIALSVERAGGAIPATFSMGAGGGNVTPGGVFTASAAYADQGGTWLLVGDGAGVAPVPVAVMGMAPGLVSRVERDAGDPADPLRSGVPWGASALDLAVSGDRAYVLAAPIGLTSPTWIDVYDIRDPLRPAWLGAVETSYRASLRIAQGRLYALSTWWDASSYTYGIAVEAFDLSGALPALVARIQEPTTQYQRSMPPAMDSEHLYVFGRLDRATGGQPLSVYELADGPLPTPRTVVLPPAPDALLPITDSYQRSATALGGRAWIRYQGTALGPAIAAWDVSVDPPALLGTTPVDSSSYVLQTDGPYLRSSWLQCLDPRPAVPVPVPCASNDPFVAHEGTRYLTYRNGLVLLDLSDLLAPVELATLSAPGWEGALVGGRYYAAERSGGIAIYDASVEGGPRHDAAGPAIGTGIATGWATAGNLLYAAGANTSSGIGFAGAWDLASSPPAQVWTSELPDPGRALAVGGGLLLVASRGGVGVHTLGDPAAPVLAATVPLDATALAIEGTRAFAGTQGGDVVVLDLSVPAAPLELGRVAPRPGVPVRAVEVLAPGRLAVALGGIWPPDGDVATVDVGGPATPVVLATLGLGEPVLDLALEGAIAAVTTATSLLTLDLSDPASPAVRAVVPLDAISLTEDASGLHPRRDATWAGSLAWISGSLGFDIGDPAWPRPVVAAPEAEGRVVVGARAFQMNAGIVTEIDLSRARNVVLTNVLPDPVPGATMRY